jgi:CRISPR/Cas system-associated protein Csx1
MKKFAEDDRIEQMKQTNRRMKQLEHRRAVDAMVEERRILSSHKGDEEKRQREIEDEISRYKSEVIEQERQRLLLDHASKLAGFLPKVIYVIIVRAFCEIEKIWTCLMKNSEKSLKNSLFNKLLES